MSELNQSDLELETFQVDPDGPEKPANAKAVQRMEEVEETIDEGPEIEADYALPPEPTRDEFEEVSETTDEPEIEADTTGRIDDFEEVEEEYEEPEEF